MIKFIIGLIAVVFLALAGYMFTQSSKTVEHKVAKKVETKVMTSHEVENPKVSQPKSKVVKVAVRSKNVVPSNSLDDDIKALQSTEYYPDKDKTSDEALSEEELLDIEKQMLPTLDNSSSDETGSSEASDADIEKLTAEEEYHPENNQTSSEPLGKEELQDIEDGLDLSQVQESVNRDENHIEVDDLANLAEESN